MDGQREIRTRYVRMLRVLLKNDKYFFSKSSLPIPTYLNRRFIQDESKQTREKQKKNV